MTHAYSDEPRGFLALAMPQGDRQAGIAGPLVQVQERSAKGHLRLRFFTRDEAQALCAALIAAESTFRVGESYDAAAGEAA